MTEFAFAETRDARDPPGKTAAFTFGFSGEQMCHPEFSGNRLGDEAVCRGNDGKCVPGSAVLLKQGSGVGGDAAQNAFTYEPFAPLLQLLRNVIRQRLEGQVVIGFDVQTACVIVARMPRAFFGQTVCIHGTLSSQKPEPEAVAVAIQQGVIEIEKRELHYQASASVGGLAG